MKHLENQLKDLHKPVFTDPHRVLAVGKRMLVESLVDQFNIQRDSGGFSQISRILLCVHCPRVIVEYGTASRPTKHSNVPEGLIGYARDTGRLVQTRCNHHGGKTYDPVKHLPITV